MVRTLAHSSDRRKVFNLMQFVLIVSILSLGCLLLVVPKLHIRWPVLTKSRVEQCMVRWQMKLKQPTCARPPRVIFSLNQTPYAKPWSKNGGSHVFVFQISPLRTHVDLWLCQLCHHCAGLSLSSCVPLPNSEILAPPLSTESTDIVSSIRTHATN